MKELGIEVINDLIKFINDHHLDQDIHKSLNDNFEDYYEEKAVLGFDIYRYSKFELKQQTLIPFIFKFIYDKTFVDLFISEGLFFQSVMENKFKDDFIDTGDGGFQIFESPLHALVFAIYFQANFKRYNTMTDVADYEILRRITERITIRYTITYDKIFKFPESILKSHSQWKSNYYGPSIIKNGRILSKDKLNRFLIDENTYDWFDKRFNGIENLSWIFHQKLKETKEKQEIFEINNSDFKNIELWEDDSYYKKSLLFQEIESNINSFKKIDIMKLKEIEAKKEEFSIYNLHLQCRLKVNKQEEDSFINRFTIDLGNTNSEGLNA